MRCKRTQTSNERSCKGLCLIFPRNTTNKKVKEVKLAILVEGDPKAPFSLATIPGCRGGRYSFSLHYFTLDTYLISLCVKQGGIKYHFFSLWYDSTLD